jgi:hypothetical protein
MGSFDKNQGIYKYKNRVLVNQMNAEQHRNPPIIGLVPSKQHSSNSSNNINFVKVEDKSSKIASQFRENNFNKYS